MMPSDHHVTYSTDFVEAKGRIWACIWRRGALKRPPKKEDLSAVYLINDEINKLRARLKNLAARNTEGTQSSSILPFSMEI